MRFKNWLMEDESEDEKMDELLVHLHTDFKEAFNNKTKLYRGTSEVKKEPYDIIKKTFKGGFRREKGENKPVTVDMLKELNPRWNEFPDRFQSTIMSVSEQEAIGFADSGHVYRLFPKNGAKIGVSPTDFNYFHEWPFNAKHFKLDHFGSNFKNEFVPQLFALTRDEFFDMHINRMLDRDQMREWFESKWKFASDYIKEHYKNEDDLFDVCVNKVLDKHKKIPIMLRKFFIVSDAEAFFNVLQTSFKNDLEKMLTTIFSPDYNDFSVCKISQIDNVKKTINSEVWTEAPCLYIDTEIMDEVTEKYKEKYGKK